MTEGTSQGLFIVVAIVIFGIFVSLSYTLFGKTLQPQIVNIFNQASENTIEKILEMKRRNLFPDSEFKYQSTIDYNFKPRGRAYLTLDKTNLHEGNNTLHHKFEGAGSQYKYSDDAVLWLTDNRFKSAILDDVMTISFKAKSKDAVEMTSRLGSNFELNDKENDLGQGMTTIKLTPEWKQYVLKFNISKITNQGVHKYPAFVYWLNKEGEFWMSDLKVELDKELIEK